MIVNKLTYKKFGPIYRDVVGCLLAQALCNMRTLAPTRSLDFLLN